MKVRLEVTDGLPEDEVLIRCGRADEAALRIYRMLLEQARAGPEIPFYKQNREYHFPLQDVLFFETAGEHVYAHTADDAFMTRFRLYELAELLPHTFVRAAKSTIVNIRRIYSVTRNLTSASRIQFAGSHKEVFASRYYYRELQRRLQERSEYET